MLKIWYAEETSTHDGYCTDGECEYEKHEKVDYLEIPEELTNNSDGWVDLEVHSEYFTKLANKYNTYVFEDRGLQSGYCEASEECKLNGLGTHERRVTIYLARILTEEEYADE